MRWKSLAPGVGAVLLAAGMANANPVVTGNVDLDFGRAAPGFTTSGTVTLNETTEVVSATGDVYLFDGVGVAATFLVTGLTNGATYSLTLPTSGTLTGPSGNVITLSNFNADVASTFNAVGTTQTIHVGAQASLPANKLGGDYTGTITIDVDPL